MKVKKNFGIEHNNLKGIKFEQISSHLSEKKTKRNKENIMETITTFTKKRNIL